MLTFNPLTGGFNVGADKRQLQLDRLATCQTTLVDLKSFSSARVKLGDIAYVSGYHTSGDGGGGYFYWDNSNNSDSVDNGFVVAPLSDPSGASGAWIRIRQEGFVNVKVFGATGDGVTDDTVAMQAAVATGEDVYIPGTSAYYLTTSNLSLHSGQRIFGDGYTSFIKNEAVAAFPDALVFTAGWLHPDDYDIQSIYIVEAISSGATSVQLVTVGDAVNLTAGDLCLVYAGYPNGDNVRQNSPAQFVEIHKITKVNEGTGVVTLDSAVRANVSNPTPSAGTWSAGTTYSGGDTVLYNGEIYLSKVSANIGNTPTKVIGDLYWSYYNIGITLLNQGTSLGKPVEIVERVTIENLRVSTENNAWLGRCALFEGLIRNIYVEKSNMLVLGNGFAKCHIENVTGFFKNEFCEAAEGTYGSTVINCHGKVHPDSTSIAAYTVNLTRPCKLINCTVDTAAVTHDTLVRLGTYYDGYISPQVEILDCTFNTNATSNILLFTASGQARVERNTFNNRGTQVNRLMYHGDVDDASHSVIRDNRFVNFTIGIRLIDLDGDRVSIDGNYFADTVNGQVACIGLTNSQFTNNRIERSSGFNVVAMAPSTMWFNNTYAADTACFTTQSAWNASHLKLGNYHLWVDGTGDLRIKNGNPASDTDGTIVGTQS